MTATDHSFLSRAEREDYQAAQEEGQTGSPKPQFQEGRRNIDASGLDRRFSSASCSISKVVIRIQSRPDDVQKEGCAVRCRQQPVSSKAGCKQRCTVERKSSRQHHLGGFKVAGTRREPGNLCDPSDLPTLPPFPPSTVSTLGSPSTLRQVHN